MRRLSLGRDAADVADHVRRRLAERIGAEQPRPDVDAGKAEFRHREARQFLVADAGLDRDRLVAARVGEQPPEAPLVARRDVDDPRQFLDRPVDVLHPVRRDLERVGGQVVGQQRAVAVVDQAALRGDRQQRDAVVLGQRVEIGVAQHLQVDEAADEEAEAASTSAQAKLSRTRRRRSARSESCTSTMSAGPRADGSRRVRSHAAAARAAAVRRSARGVPWSLPTAGTARAAARCRRRRAPAA